MATTLLAVLLVIACAYAQPDWRRLRDFSWLKAWATRWSDGTREGSSFPLTVVWLPLVVVILCALIQAALDQVLFGLPGFAFGAAVLFYAWGPRDLDADIEAVLKAPDSERREAAAQTLRPDPATITLALRSAPLVEATFASALARWFGVLFWFVVLGPAGALGYRCVQLLARHTSFAAVVGAPQNAVLERTARVLDWAPSHLMALALALVSEFDTVIQTWRDYHAAHGRGYFTLDLGFLGAIARAGIDADVTVESSGAADTGNPLLELADARTVLRRILVVWLAVIAVMALIGVGH